MREMRLIMGMPITVVIPDRERMEEVGPEARYGTNESAAKAVFDYFRAVDERFSPFKPASETSRISRGEMEPRESSSEMQEVLRLSEETRQLTDGYFDVWFEGRFDPSGLVKGWAISKAAGLLDADGFVSFCIEAGGDIEARGANDEGLPWAIGIRSPFDPSKLVRKLLMSNRGIATSGTYIRGEHIYNPRTGGKANEIASLTVIGDNAYEADRIATAAFAMGHARCGVRCRTGRPGRLHGGLVRNGNVHAGLREVHGDMIKILDRFLNRFTMYRLTLYYLAALLYVAAILGAFGLVPGGPVAIVSTTAVLLAACFLVNALFARVLRIRSNPESSLITALIMALIMGPAPIITDPKQAAVLALAGAVAVASKYLLAFRRQHVFNPAAAGALFSAFVFGANASWWVGNAALLPLVVVGGFLLARKIGRLRLVAAFLGLFVAFNLGLALAQGLAAADAAQSVLFVLGHTSLVFFATVMFTEPMTSPKRFPLQLAYAAIVAFLYQPQLSLLGQNLTPEEALMAGNLFSFLVSPSFKLRLPLKERTEIGRGIMSFTFPRPTGFTHGQGQYMEWTLPLKKGDSRGARRYFSIASSPTEPDLMIAARFSPKPSRYKEEMARMKMGDLIMAGELGGRFRASPRLAYPPCVHCGRHRDHAVSKHDQIPSRQRRAAGHRAVVLELNRGRSDLSGRNR